MTDEEEAFLLNQKIYDIATPGDRAPVFRVSGHRTHHTRSSIGIVAS
jgi:hypothetical protein